MKTEVITLNRERNVTLTTYLQQTGGEFANIPKRPAVLILPGGGYDNCSEREAEVVTYPYLHAGYHAFVLRYSLKDNKTWPNPLDDYEEAMSLIRRKADEWHLYADKIAVIGFSAGGHLAASAATMSVNRPNAAILVYAVLDRKSTDEWNPTAPAPLSYVDEKMPPCFLAASRNDTMVPVINTIQFTEELFRYGIPFESHIYSFAPHGFSVADTTVMEPGAKYSRRVSHWVDDSIDWLKEVFGDFADGKMTEPEV